MKSSITAASALMVQKAEAFVFIEFLSLCNMQITPL
jgi:hypothetical protein